MGRKSTYKKRERFYSSTLAVKQGNTEIVEALLKYYIPKAQPETPTAAVTFDYQEGSKNINPTIPTARRAESIPNAKATLVTASTPNINAVFSNGNTALHLAASEKETKIIQALDAKGADINAQNSNGSTPLHIAASYENPQMIQALIAVGADINAVNQKGQTPHISL